MKRLIKKIKKIHCDVLDIKESEDRSSSLGVRPLFEAATIMSNYSRFDLSYTAEFTQMHPQAPVLDENQTSWLFVSATAAICELTDDGGQCFLTCCYHCFTSFHLLCFFFTLSGYQLSQQRAAELPFFSPKIWCSACYNSIWLTIFQNVQWISWLLQIRLYSAL